MTIEQINALKLEDVLSIILMRLELPEGEEATEEQLQAEFEAYKAELIAEEEARLAEEARMADLKARFAALSDVGLIQAQGIQNPAAHFEKVILKASSEDAESMLSDIESKYQTELNKAIKLKEVQAKMELGKKARSACDSVLDLISGYNLDRELTVEQISGMQSAFAPIESALRSGRPSLAKALISQVEPDEVIVTQEMKSLVLELLSDY